MKHEMGAEVSENLRELLLDQDLEAKFKLESDGVKMIELYMKDKPLPKDSVNAKLISHGYAKLILDNTLP